MPENWDIDTAQFEEPEITQRIKSWTGEWEKERNKKNAVSKAIFVNKYIKTLCLTFLMLIKILFMLVKMK